MIHLLLWIGIFASPLQIDPAPNDDTISGAPIGAQHCGRLNSVALARRIRGVRAELAIRADSFGRLSHLINYWRSRCPHERFNASVSDVQSLARLLDLRFHRFNLSLMLIDVGRNLSAAIPELERAVADENDIVTRARAADPAWAPFIGSYNGEPLRCILEKARSGRINGDTCRALIRLDRQYREEGH